MGALIRLAKIAIEYNLPPQILIEYLRNKNFQVSNSINQILIVEMLEVIDNEHHKNKEEKNKSNLLNISLPSQKKYLIELVCDCGSKFESYNISESDFTYNPISENYGEYVCEQLCTSCSKTVSLKMERFENRLFTNMYRWVININGGYLVNEEEFMNEYFIDVEEEKENDDRNSNFNWGGLRGQEAYDAM
ncbi:MAG TPA: hypothetical protein PK006_10150 [Saprospiraceae bacterium]|nr:hypothetical protein [Saprospiraceae bacterium]